MSLRDRSLAELLFGRNKNFDKKNVSKMRQIKIRRQRGKKRINIELIHEGKKAVN